MTTKKTRAPRFHPYLDQSQWPEYHGIQQENHIHHGGPSVQSGTQQRVSQHAPTQQRERSQAPTQQRVSQQSLTQQRVSQQASRPQRGRQLGLSRGRVGFNGRGVGIGRGGGRRESMIGYLHGPFPYVTPFKLCIHIVYDHVLYSYCLTNV